MYLIMILTILQVEVEHIDIGEPENPGNCFNLLILVYVHDVEIKLFNFFYCLEYGPL